MPIFEDKKKNIGLPASFREILAKSDIERQADKSRERLDSIHDERDFEKKLEEQQQEREKQREELRKSKGSEVHDEARNIGTHHLVYQAKSASLLQERKKRKKEGFIHRTGRLIKGISDAKSALKDDIFVTREKRIKLYTEVLEDAWEPAVTGFKDAANNLWDFISRVGHDFWDIILFIVDAVIFVVYHLSSAALIIWDRLWDLFFLIDKHKRKLFLWFSSAVGVVAVVLILISSVSAYEYSYYGTVLGTARSKQDVYQTIDILGDKLSIATGANINIDVERDMTFKRVYGFKLNVDSTDDILTTLTYMKDLQTEAFAICVDGETRVIVESEDVAKDVISAIRNDFAGARSGVEYQTIIFEESVTVEPVNVLLADVWNPKDAVRYMETGTTMENPAEDYVKSAYVTVRSLETATYEEIVGYDIDYIDNPTMYSDEKELITDGINGVDVVIANIERVNGEEVSRTIVSTTRMSNPINATYYKGTKAIPEKKGTGTWVFPLKVSAPRTSYFGERYGVVGVSSVHKGVDYGVPEGTKVYAADGGVVVFAGYKSSYGYMVEIDHGGLYTSVYAHLSKLLVKTGDSIYQGQNIALSGDTGISTGAHLHFEVRYKGEPINPESLF